MGKFRKLICVELVEYLTLMDRWWLLRMEIKSRKVDGSWGHILNIPSKYLRVCVDISPRLLAPTHSYRG